jgi:hypothetical protein
VPSIRPLASTPWDEALIDAIQDIHAALTNRPAVAELLVSLPLNGAWIEQVREPLLDLVRGAGFGERQAVDGLSIIFNYLLGAVLIDARRARGGSPDSFATGLRYLVDGLMAEPRKPARGPRKGKVQARQ